MSRFSSLLSLYVRESRSQLLLSIFYTLLLPGTAVYFTYCVLAADPQRAHSALTLGVVLALGTGPVSVLIVPYLTDRFMHRHQLLRACGLTKRAYLALLACLSVAHSALTVAALLVGLRILGQAAVAPAAALAIVAGGVGTGACVTALLLIVASRSPSVESGTTLAGLAALALAITSPVFYDPEALAAVPRALAALSPHTHFISIWDGALGVGALAWQPFAALAVWAGLASGTAYRVCAW